MQVTNAIQVANVFQATQATQVSQILIFYNTKQWPTHAWGALYSLSKNKWFCYHHFIALDGSDMNENTVKSLIKPPWNC